VSANENEAIYWAIVSVTVFLLACAYWWTNR
jgi:hypothetical protein